MGSEDRGQDQYLTYRQAADRCGVSHHTVRYWAKAGLLPVVRLNQKMVRISSRALDEFFAAHTTKAAGA